MGKLRAEDGHPRPYEVTTRISYNTDLSLFSSRFTLIQAYTLRLPLLSLASFHAYLISLVLIASACR